jgi:hypothetical protein
MFCEMVCTCEASLNIDSENEDGIWMLAWRFANSHAQCGYVTPAHDMPNLQTERKTKVITPDLSMMEDIETTTLSEEPDDEDES